VTWIRRAAHLYRRLRNRQQIEDELNDELQAYLDIQAERHIARGLSREEALRTARIKCQGPEQVKEKVRDVRVGAAMETSLRDIQFAWRMLRKSPTFAAVAVLSLALGIGANTAIFSVIYAVVLRSLPVKHPEQLVELDRFNLERSNLTSFTYPFYRELRDRGDLFAGVLCSSGMSPSLSVNGSAERVSGEMVSSNYFDVLGLKPYVGRLFRPEDETAPGANPVAVLSYGFWRRRFASDPKVIGTLINLNTTPMTIIGVSPPEFDSLYPGESRDIRVPITMQPQMELAKSNLAERYDWWLSLVGRLKPGVPSESTEAALTVFLQAYLKQNHVGKKISKYEGEVRQSERMHLLPAGTGLTTKAKRAAKQLYVLMAVVVLVLLSGCMNLANLLLARTATRQREIAIRLSLGAGRWRLICQLLTESILLALAGGCLGILLSIGGGRVLANFLLAGQTGVSLDVAPDGHVLAFAVGLSLVTGLLFGLAPALGATRLEVAPELKGEPPRILGARIPWRKMLVSFQVAISVVLLIGAGLFLKSLNRLRSMDLGFDKRNVLEVSVDPTLNGYSQERARIFYRELQEKVSHLPGVLSVSFSRLGLVGGGDWGSGITVEGYQPKEGEPGPDRDIAGDRYFATLRIPLLRGRDFGPGDHLHSPHVAIVNESFARFYFGKQNPIGKLIGPGGDYRGDRKAMDFTIVGVAKDGKYQSMREDAPRFWYVPYEQYNESREIHGLVMYARTAGDPLKEADAVRQVVRAIDPKLPLFNVKSLEQQIDADLATERMVATLSTFFSLLATLVVAIGLYGVMTYAVTKRTREIGIRMALGAQSSMVVRSIMGEVVVLIAAGIALGVPCALGLGKLLASLLFETKPQDDLALTGATLLAAVVTLLAGYLPARRAASISPTVALRYE
jgi:predicted permease